MLQVNPRLPKTVLEDGWRYPLASFHSADVGLKVRCNYNLSNRTVSNAANALAVAGGINEAGAENTVVRSPNVTLRVTDRYVFIDLILLMWKRWKFFINLNSYHAAFY